ncbi:MAG: MBL fold metallo-hydrolase, partial [Bdellovibrionota bacterium]
MPKKPIGSTWTILGCGTSTGVPLIICSCVVCRSRNPRNKRLRAAAWLQTRGKSILIDTSPDLRTQAIKFKIPRVDAVLFTHPHADHIHGIDELRSYTYVQGGRIPVFGNAWTESELRKKFEYIFQPAKSIEGGGIPMLDLHPIRGDEPVIDLLGIPVVPLRAAHGSTNEVLGFRVDSVAYMTDCSYIPAETLGRMDGLVALVLDCVRIAPHDTH